MYYAMVSAYFLMLEALAIFFTWPSLTTTSRRLHDAKLFCQFCILLCIHHLIIHIL